MDMRTIADTLEIQALLATYVFAIDDKDMDALDQVFAPDAHIDYRSTGGAIGDWTQIKPWLAKALAPFPVTQHLIGMPAIRLDGDRATSRTMLFNPIQVKRPDGSDYLFFIGASYRDKLARTPDGWRIVERIETDPWFKDPPADLQAPAIDG